MRKLIVSEFVSLDGVLSNAGEADLARHDDHPRQRRRGGAEVEGPARTEHRDGRQQSARAPLLAYDLVDELHLLLYPLTLGRGKRL